MMFRFLFVPQGLVSAVTAEPLTVTRSSPPSHVVWQISGCTGSEQKNSQVGQSHLLTATSREELRKMAVLSSSCLTGHLKLPVPNNCYKKQTTEL